MRIGIDLHSATSFMQGTRTYILNIVKHLLKIDKENEYFLYVTRESSSLEHLFSRENVFFKYVPHHRIIRIPISVPIRLALDSIDVFHCQYMGPPFARTPYVVILHDIIFEYIPELYQKSLSYLMHVFYPLSARRASRVLTISEHSKRDIVKFYKIPEEKVIVTYNGVSEDFHPIMEKDTIKDTLKKYGVNGEYILFVGRLEPRKNLPRLVLAFHELKKYKKIKQKLVIVGMKYYRYEETLKAVNDLGLHDEVIFTGGAEDADLPIIYNGASLFVYPSIAEGFGLPPLEAMACGIPVISSNTSSLPEIIGDAGILVDPYKTEDLVKAMYEVLSNKNLQEKMKTEGLKRARRFSWEQTARKTLEVYHEVYMESKGNKYCHSD